MKHEYRVEYKNVLVRPLIIDDIEYLRMWRNDPKNTKYLKKLGYITKEQQKEWFEKYLINTDEYSFAILENIELNRIVGSASLYEFNDSQVEFGKILIGDDEAHGKSVGYNAIKAILKIAFEDFMCKKVVLKCFKDNKRAYHLYEKVGFKVIDEYYTNENKQEVLMEITSNDFTLD